MLLLVGLGNPGPKYANNRHNVGYMVADALHARYGTGPFRGKFGGQLADAEIGGEKVMLLKPTTYMNASGRSVGAVARFFKIRNKDVTVFYDELDLAPGKVRVKRGGGTAGHNGVKSVADQIGPQFRRVRVGIGHPGDRDRVTGHVLKDFTKTDAGWLAKLLDAIAEETPLLVADDDAGFMSRVALHVSPPKPKAAAKSGNKEPKDEEPKGSGG